MFAGTTRAVAFGTTGVIVAAMAVAATAVPAQAPTASPADRRNFVSCPYVRDTRTVPCWLADYDGDTYYLGSQGSTSSAFYPPQLLHEVLVEAVVGDGPRICGGIPLVDVEVSVRPELNRACNTILPAEPGHVAPPSPPASIPHFDDTTREFRVPHDFESDYLTLHTTRILHEVVRIAKAVAPVRIEVRGARAAVLLSNGEALVEPEGLARERAEDVAKILVGLGLPSSAVRAEWSDDVAAPDGVSDRHRRVTVVRLVGR